MKKMRIGVILLMLAVSLTLSSCITRIEPGHVGIKVNNMGSERGVQDYTLKTGVVFYMPFFTSIFDYPTFVQTAVWSASKYEGKTVNEEISFNTKEGTSIQGDISLSYNLEASKVPQFYVKFRTDDLQLFTHGFLRNIARDAFNEVGSNYTLEDAYGSKKEELLKEIKKRVNLEVGQYGINIVQFGFVGSLRMDKEIMAALNTKLTAIQKAIAAENQLRQAQAEARKMVAKAEGEAKSNEVLARSITPQLVQWRNLEITEKAVGRWDGRRPTVEGNNSGLLLQIPVSK